MKNELKQLTKNLPTIEENLPIVIKLNKDKFAEYQAKYRKKNKDKISEYQAKYYKKNKDKFAKYNAKYYKKNKDKIAEYRKKNKRERMKERYDKLNEDLK